MNAIIEIVIESITAIAASLIVVYITLQYILCEQRKAAEMPFKPVISFPHYPHPTMAIQCIVRQNNAYNIIMHVEIGGNSIKGELGSVFIRTGQEEGKSEILDLPELPERYINVLEEQDLRITVSYMAPTGSGYTEKFIWKKCKITESGILILPRTGSGSYWELSEAPWF
jgi:hypothetical protein